MQYSDRINFVDDSETIQLYSFGLPGEMAGFDHMVDYGKHNPYDMSFLSMNYPHPHHMGQCMAPAHETPQTTQQDLAALPSNFHADFNDSPSYIVPPAYEYAPLPRATLPSSAVCPSNMPVQLDTQPRRLSASVTTNTQPLKRRRVSDESLEAAAPVPKKLVLSLQEPSGEFHNLKSEASPYSLVPTPTTVPSYHSFCAVASPHAGSHQHTTSIVSHVSAAAAPYTPIVSPAFTTANTEHSPHAPATPAPRPASTMSNPKLVRTSTIPTHSSPSVNHNAYFSNNNITAFNPYAMHSPHSKARLHLEGDLDEVANVWSQEDLAATRKSVVFEREQKGNDIHASFKVVSQNEWKNHPRTINCIWWKEKKEAFVTSVDTILLLESLVAARFTVEEKSRIRRNLEGFKPLTVSKGKSDSEDFFKVIMGFPNPKPRNIEKDVKVFPWKILSVALQKIIGKYAASYASTAGSMMGQPTKIYRPLEFMTEQHLSASPGPECCVPMSHMVGYGPYNHGRLSAPATPVLRVHYVPQVSQAQDLPAGCVRTRHDASTAAYAAALCWSSSDSTLAVVVATLHPNRLHTDRSGPCTRHGVSSRDGRDCRLPVPDESSYDSPMMTQLISDYGYSSNDVLWNEFCA